MTKKGDKKRKKKESTDTDTSNMSQSSEVTQSQKERDSRSKGRTESKRRKESLSRDRNIQTVLNFQPIHSANTFNTPAAMQSDTSNAVLDKLDTLQATSNSHTKQMEDCRSSLSKQIDERIEKLSGIIFDLQQENASLRKTLDQTIKLTQELKDEVKSLRSVVMDQREHLNNLEQYSRRESVRVYGVKGDVRGETSRQCEEKVLKIIQEKLKLRDIDSTKISAIHRLGRVERGKDRPVIVRFVSRKDHAAVLRERRNLKKTGVGISEDLTKLNFQRLGRLRQHEGVLEAWSAAGGRLFAKLLDLSIVEIVGGNTSVIDHKLIGHTIDPSRHQQQQRRQLDRPDARREWNNVPRARPSSPKDHSTPQTAARHNPWSLPHPLQSTSATGDAVCSPSASSASQQGEGINGIQNRLQALVDSSGNNGIATTQGGVGVSGSDSFQEVNKAGDPTQARNHCTVGSLNLEGEAAVGVNEPMLQ